MRIKALAGSPIGSSNHPSATPNQQLNNSTMVMLNGKTYAPSSYVGSPWFTRMEKTACTMFTDGDKYPTTKEVRLLLTLHLVSIIVTSCRLSILLCSGWRSRRRTSGTSWRRGCPWTTWFIMGALLLSTRTNWIIGQRTCPSMMLLCTISSMLVPGIWMPLTSLGTLQHIPCGLRLVWGTASGP